MLTLCGRYLKQCAELCEAGRTTALGPPPGFWAADAREAFRKFQDAGQVVVGLRSKDDLDDQKMRTNWRRDRRMGFYRDAWGDEGAVQKGSGEPAAFFSRTADDPCVVQDGGSAAFPAWYIGRTVLRLLLRAEDELDTGLTPRQAGLDSLMAIEVQMLVGVTWAFSTSFLDSCTCA